MTWGNPARPGVRGPGRVSRPASAHSCGSVSRPPSGRWQRRSRGLTKAPPPAAPVRRCRGCRPDPLLRPDQRSALPGAGTRRPRSPGKAPLRERGWAGRASTPLSGRREHVSRAARPPERRRTSAVGLREGVAPGRLLRRDRPGVGPVLPGAAAPWLGDPAMASPSDRCFGGRGRPGEPSRRSGRRRTPGVARSEAATAASVGRGALPFRIGEVGRSAPARQPLPERGWAGPSGRREHVSRAARLPSVGAPQLRGAVKASPRIAASAGSAG